MGRILIVDDSKLMRKIIRSMVEGFPDHQVVAEAASAQEALLQYRANNPDLVTMDIAMPGTDGIQTVRMILAEFPQARIIMVSSVNEKEQVLQAMAAGARYYILKPLNAAKIETMLEKAFGHIQPPLATPPTTE